MPAYQPDPYAQQNSINSAVQQGFGGIGQYFFNALDLNIAKTNMPISKNPHHTEQSLLPLWYWSPGSELEWVSW